MEIILLQDVDKVGEKHEVVKVKDGYGRNYLIPQGLALIANKTNRNRLDEMKRQEEAREMKKYDDYKAIADALVDKVIKIGAKAGTSGKIFGSVTSIQISNALKEQFDLDVDRRKVHLPEEVKELGTYTLVLNLHTQVKPEVKFEVVAE
ncbi:MAG: 50S ribosomal protein L9 [Saprospiraceae bacterium]|nr:50S ribosomal protein L9 [Lewinella sp.]